MRNPLAPFAKFRRAFALLREQRAAVLVGAACVPVSAVCALALPLIAGTVLDDLRAGVSRGELVMLCALFASVALLDVALRFVARHRLINASREMEARLKAELMSHVGSLPVAWYDRARTGDLISRLTQDVELLRFITGPTLLHGGQALVIVPGGLYMMFALSGWVALAALCAFAVLVGAMRVLLPKLRDRSRAVQESIGALSQHCTEAFSGVRVLQAFSRLRDEARHVRGLSQDCLENNLKVARLQALVNVTIHGCIETVILAVLVVGALEAIRGVITVGELLEFYALLGIMVWPLLALGWLASAFPRAAAAADRIEEIFALEPEPRGGLEIEPRGDIEVRGLTFTYPDKDRPALQDVTFELRQGSKLGIVGPVGSGKSTLLALLLRLYDPPRGAIFLDGHDVLDLDPRALRRAFAFAPQEPFLFSDTVANNVEFGRGAHEPIEPFLRAACLDADIDAMPDGLETVVGVRGVTLSGGQKQRAALARALAADRPVLLLDDTLSAVDHATESRILARLLRLQRERTTVVATHRLSAIADADQILVLDDGRVEDRGTHEELARDERSFYGAAWRRQREERALEGDG